MVQRKPRLLARQTNDFSVDAFIVAPDLQRVTALHELTDTAKCRESAGGRYPNQRDAGVVFENPDLIIEHLIAR